MAGGQQVGWLHRAQSDICLSRMMLFVIRALAPVQSFGSWATGSCALILLVLLSASVLWL